MIFYDGGWKKGVFKEAVIGFSPFQTVGGGRGWGLWALSKVESSVQAHASPSDVCPAGKLQRHFTYGFDFGHSLWLTFVAAFAVLKGLMGGKFSALNTKLMTLELDDRDKMVICFLLFCKREIIFETIFWIAGTQNEVPDRVFPWEFL